MKGSAANFEFELSAEDDRQKLFIDVRRTAAGNIVLDYLLKEIEKHVSLELLDTAVLKDICQTLETEKEVKRRRIAKGTMPSKGKSGRLILLVRYFSPEAAPRRTTGEKSEIINYREINLFDNIEVGQELARIYPPKEGKPGRDVFGTEIPAEKGDEYITKLGVSIEQRQLSGKNYTSLFAKTHGCLLKDGESLEVSREMTIDGDLDYRYGSMSFIGTLVVRGNVLPGFRVKAREGITIQGDVDQSSLISSEGDISIEGRVFGKEGTLLIAGGMLQVKSLMNLEVEAFGDVLVEEYIRDCSIYCDGVVRVSNGEITNGETGVTVGVEAASLGTEVGTETELLALDTFQIKAEYRNLVAKHARYQKAREVVEAHLGPYRRNEAMLNRLQPEFKQKIEALLKKYLTLRKSEVAAEEALERAVTESPKDQECIFSASEVIHEGCHFYGPESDIDFFVSEAVHGPKSVVYIQSTKNFSLCDFKKVEEKTNAE